MAETKTSERTHTLSNTLQKKLECALEYITGFDSAVVAFSGGVDSAVVAWMCCCALKDRTMLVTARSCLFPRFELDDAGRIARFLGVAHHILEFDETSVPRLVENDPQRCYHCKHGIFSRICTFASSQGFGTIFDGTNADDAHDYRPGKKALSELGIHSPLAYAGLTKNDIRALAGHAGLDVAHKPAYACLASRFPYGEKITTEKLQRVGNAEAAVRELGFTQFRIRSHGDCARIELITEEMDKGWTVRESIARCCRDAGFQYAAIDCRGYRRGAMNEILPSPAASAED